MKQEEEAHAVEAIRRRFYDVLEAEGPSDAEREWRRSRFENGLRLADELERLIGSLTDRRVLDVGAAFGGEITALFSRGAQCVGADMFDHNYEQLARQVSPQSDRLRFTRFDCTKPWPIETETFDVVISLSVIEIVDDLDSFFAELLRVLKPDGVAVVYTGTALRMVRRDPLYKLPLISLLPTKARRWVAETIFKRKYRFHVSNHTFYSANHFRPYVCNRGGKILPVKYADGKVMRWLGKLPLASLCQRLISYLAFDFVLISHAGKRS